MSDLISRADAIESIASRDPFDGAVPYFSGKMVIGYINALPSVQPTHTTPSNVLNSLDCVDRAEAIKAVKFYETFCAPYPRVIEALEELPSIQPDKDLIHLQKEQAYMQGYEDGKKSRSGKWTYADGTPVGPWAGYGVYCSACKEKSEYATNYCGMCGADMRGDAE